MDLSHGITVVGFARIQTPPDRAVVELAVTRVAEKPADAFRAAHDASATVSAAFATLGARSADVATAHPRLEQVVGAGGATTGYRAVIGFRVVLTDLRRLEALLVGAIGLGADRLERLSFTTSQQGELRAEARRRAIEAARSKAELYAASAGVRVGAVLRIEDEELGEGRAEAEAPIDSLDETTAVDWASPPGSIVARAAVRVTYAIEW